MDDRTYSQAGLRAILTETRSIAAVGVSLNPIRPSAYVTRYLSTKGFRLIGVNPAHVGETLFGEPVVARLADIPEAFGPVDMVEIFRRSEKAGAVADEALAALLPRGLRTIWMQIGVSDPAAAARAEAQGVRVIMNRCPKIEYQRLFSELRIGGFNTGIISSKLPR
jgi:predicted CoA-binding protein